MLSKRPLSNLASFDRQLLRYQWLSSGKCARCFHASIRRTADYEDKDTTVRQVESTDTESSNDTAQSVPAPNRTRHQRAAQASEEIRMLQRDRPATGFGEADPNTLRPPGAGGTVDPEAIGLDVRPGSMGANDAPQHDGPLAQGINMSARTDVDAGVDKRAVRSSGVPFTEEDPTEKAASGAVDIQAQSDGQRLGQPNEITDEQAKFIPSHSEVISKRDLDQSYNSSTIAAANFSGLISDHITRVSSPGIDEKNRDITVLANKLIAGQLVHFVSRQEKAAALETAKVIARRRAAASKSSRATKTVDTGAVQSDAAIKSRYTFAPIPLTVQQSLIDKMVAGKYDTDGLLEGKTNEKQPVLNEIRKTLALNSTYLPQDADRVLRKVKSLLPTALAESQKAGQQRKTD